MSETNRQLADLLQELADLLAVEGADRFRIRAYERAARAVREQPGDVTTLARSALEAIPGVGKGIARAIEEFAQSGRLTMLDSLRAETPPAALRALMEVPGLGPKGALRLYRELGITTLADLRDAMEQGRLREVKGFGPRAEENILRGLEHLESAPKRMLLPTALELAHRVLGRLRDVPGVQRADYAGSLRRLVDTIGDIDLLVAATEPHAASEALVALPLTGEVLARGASKTSVRTVHGVQVDLRVVPLRTWGAALQYFTGSKEHNVRLRELALRKGMRLSEYGLEDAETGRLVAGAAEEDVYEALGMPFVPPVLREDRGEVQAALRGELPSLVTVADLRGDLQTHSTYSDGRASLRDMVAAAAARGYEYYAVTDHGRNLTFMRQNLSLDAIDRQRAEVRALNEEFAGRIRVLHGVELNVGLNGELDYPDDVLAGFDVVVASVHHELRTSRETMTRRLLRAIENPYVSFVGHPTNRRLGRRPESDIDLDAVFAAAAAAGVPVEINSLPERLDLRDEHAIRARSYGALFTIDTDAHEPAELANISLGVAQAQRAWIGPDEVVNTWPLDRMLAHLHRRRPD